MSLVLELPASLEAELAAESERLGVSISEVVVKRMSANKKVEANHKPNNGKELVAYWRQHGIIGSRSDLTESDRYARALRAESESRVTK